MGSLIGPMSIGSSSRSPGAQLGSPLCPPRSEVVRDDWHVAFVPISEVAALFNHLIGARQHRGRDVEIKRSCSLEVDNQFEFGRLFDR